MSDIYQINRSENVAVAGKHEPAVATSAGRGSPTRAGGEASVAGEAPPHGGRFSAEGMARLRALGKANLRSPEAIARRAAIIAEKAAWTEETKAQVRAWAQDGVSLSQIGRRLHLALETVKRRAKIYGIDLSSQKPDLYEAGAVVLREHYEADTPTDEVHRLYCAARGKLFSRNAMEIHARKLNLRRPIYLARRAAGRARGDLFRAERVGLAPQVQAMLDERRTLEAISAALRISQNRLQVMLKLGEVVRSAPPLKVVAPRIQQPRVPKPKAPKPPKASKPKALPKSWVRSPAPAPQPKVAYQTVEAWLAAGGRITQCPAAAVHVTTATLGEGRDVIRQHAAAMAGDDGNWVSRAKKKMGRFQFGAGK